MTMIMTTLHKDYQPQWGVDWAIREILSNAIDGEARNAPEGVGQMTFHYREGARTLVVTNDGIAVPTKALLLGTSDSRGRTDCIGTFGEGLPMALLVLARNHYPVTIYNGIEKWEPMIAKHEELGDEEVLAIKTRQMIKARGHFSVEIAELDREDFNAIQGMFLRFDPNFDKAKVIEGSCEEQVLLQPSYRGRVYNKGVFVCEKPKLMFGYNLNTTLNRDRSMMDEWDLKYKLDSLLRDAVSRDPQFIHVLDKMIFGGTDQLELSSVYTGLAYSDSVKKHFVEEFVRRYGEAAVPLTDNNDLEELKSLGHTGIVVSPMLMAIVKSSFPTLATLKAKYGTAIKRYYGYHDWSDVEVANIAKVRHVHQKLGLNDGIGLADFATDLVICRNEDNVFWVAREAASDSTKLLFSTLREAVRDGKLKGRPGNMNYELDVAWLLSELVMKEAEHE